MFPGKLRALRESWISRRAAAFIACVAPPIARAVTHRRQCAAGSNPLITWNEAAGVETTRESVGTLSFFRADVSSRMSSPSSPGTCGTQTQATAQVRQRSVDLNENHYQVESHCRSRDDINISSWVDGKVSSRQSDGSSRR